MTRSQEIAIRQLFFGFFISDALDLVEGVTRSIVTIKSETYWALHLAYIAVERPILVCFFAFSLWRLGLSANPRYRRYLGVFILLGLFGLGNGIVRGNDWYSIIADLLLISYSVLVLMIAVRVFELCTLDYFLSLLMECFSKWKWALFTSFPAFVLLRHFNQIHYPAFLMAHMGIAITLWSMLELSNSRRTGIQNPRFFRSKVSTLAVIGWAIVLLSGNRTVLVALILATVIRSLWFMKMTPKFILRVVGVAAVLAGIISYVVTNYSFADLKKSNIVTLQKFTSLDPSEFSFESPEELNYYLALATAGRWFEVIGVIDELIKDESVAWVGKGFGATYTVMSTDNDAKFRYDEGKYRNVHFSYLNVILLFGGLLSIPFFWVVLEAIFRVTFYAGVNSVSSTHRRIVFQSLIFQLFFACFLCAFFQDFFLWFFVGYGLSLERAKKPVPVRKRLFVPVLGSALAAT